MSRRALFAVFVAVLSFGAACGGGDDPTTPDAPPAVGGGGADLASFQVEVRDGEVVGGSQREEVPLGSTVRVTVMSDVADEVHVHGYDERTEIGAGGTVEVTFEADTAGVFVVELEETKVELLELEVR